MIRYRIIYQIDGMLKELDANLYPDYPDTNLEQDLSHMFKASVTLISKREI